MPVTHCLLLLWPLMPVRHVYYCYGRLCQSDIVIVTDYAGKILTQPWRQHQNKTTLGNIHNELRLICFNSIFQRKRITANPRFTDIRLKYNPSLRTNPRKAHYVKNSGYIHWLIITNGRWYATPMKTSGSLTSSMFYRKVQYLQCTKTDIRLTDVKNETCLIVPNLGTELARNPRTDFSQPTTCFCKLFLLLFSLVPFILSVARTHWSSARVEEVSFTFEWRTQRILRRKKNRGQVTFVSQYYRFICAGGPKSMLGWGDNSRVIVTDG